MSYLKADLRALGRHRAVASANYAEHVSGYPVPDAFTRMPWGLSAQEQRCFAEGWAAGLAEYERDGEAR